MRNENRSYIPEPTLSFLRHFAQDTAAIDDEDVTALNAAWHDLPEARKTVIMARAQYLQGVSDEKNQGPWECAMADTMYADACKSLTRLILPPEPQNRIHCNPVSESTHVTGYVIWNEANDTYLTHAAGPRPYGPLHQTRIYVSKRFAEQAVERCRKNMPDGDWKLRGARLETTN